MKTTEFRKLIREEVRKVIKEVDKTNIAEFKETIKKILTQGTAVPSFSPSGDTYSTKESSIPQMIKAIEDVIQQYK